MPSQLISYQSPVGGWNAFNALDNMPPTDAVILDNFFPQTSYIQLRRGYTQYADTGQSAPVQTLATYNGGNATRLIAAAGGSVFDASSGSLFDSGSGHPTTHGPPVSLGSGYHSDIWSWVNYASGGGTFLLMANDSGADIPQVYNGTTLAAMTITGVPAASLSQVTIYAQRAFYVQSGTLSVWYATAGAYQGALIQFDFGPLCTRGGAIAAISTWTRDNGFGGADDLFVVVTTRGEVLIYAGTNPGDSDFWSMSGRFLIGAPVAGPRCVTRIGPDMMLICEDGFQPLSTYLSLGETKTQTTNLAVKIGNAASDAVRAFKSATGWQAQVYPQGTQMIVNVPQGNGVFHQYVANTTTGAWCRYKGLDAWCWGILAGAPYFGGANGKIYQWDVGPSDNGVDIVGEVCTAFQHGGAPAILKRFQLARPLMQTNGNLTFAIDMGVDFDTSKALQTISSNYPSGGLWGSGLWGVMLWGQGLTLKLFRRVISVTGLGVFGAVRIKISTHTTTVNINSVDVIYEPGLIL